MKNSFGNIFRITTFGESHGPAIGGVIDGMPARVGIDLEEIQIELNRRRPGQSNIVSARSESDKVTILSGLFEGKTTGASIGFIIQNENQHSEDYANLANVFRPSHADFTYQQKYGIREHRGGGRSSARDTAARVVAGAFAKQVLRKLGISVVAYTSQVGTIKLDKDYHKYDMSLIDSNPVRCPDLIAAREMEALISKVKAEGDTIGGIVTCIVKGVPAGLGEPIYNKLQATLASAMLSINAAKGFEYGKGFDFAEIRGTEVIDNFICRDGKIHTATNYSGGIQGGISNGEDIYFRVAFKPVATLLRDVPTIDKNGEATVVKARGRHDACVLPRAVPIVEAMAAITMLDAYLLNKTTHL